MLGVLGAQAQDAVVGGDAVAVGFADGDGVVDDLLVHKGGDGEVDEDDVLVRAVGVQVVHPVDDRLLVAAAPLATQRSLVMPYCEVISRMVSM